MVPLTVNQPWGVFFLEFDGLRLPITQVRRLLKALVVKKRTVGSGSLRTWCLDDLLFFVITGADDSLELHLLAFHGNTSQSAEPRSLAWRPAQSPSRHLNRLSRELLPGLRWPDDSNDIESWRAKWRKPFKLPVGQVIKDSARLADRMAKIAQDLRDQIEQHTIAEHDRGPLSTLMEQIREQLISTVDTKSFADMCAQTLVYGMLSSRVANPQDFGSSPVLLNVPLANPFLEAFFEQVHDQAAVLDLAGSGLPQLVADLQATNVEAILDQVGSTVKGGDPVIHFYEHFLAQYDRKIRINAGAFYTPQPAVEFMVRMVDQVLRSRFSLSLGVADDASWGEVALLNGFTVPEDIDPAKPFVSMVDPATGTGTFLVEWIKRARQSFHESGGTISEWRDYLRNSVLPSIHAFEFMLAPYTVAHLKVALELHDANIGVSDSPLAILLTNTLEHTATQGQFPTMCDPVATEGRRAAVLKQSERFTVVIGNPPYDREQHVKGNTGLRKGGVVRYGMPGIDPLLRDVTEPMRDAGLGHHLKNVYNDYVYFWRWAVWQATELTAGPGVVAFITAASFLDGVSMGGVRHMLRKAFDELWIVDLGGEGRGARTEENIFDIRTPVAVAIGVRTGDPVVDECIVRYLRVKGTRADKLARLGELGIDDINERVDGKDLVRFTPTSDAAYFSWPKITDLFPWTSSGCQLKRTWPISETKVVLQKRWKTLVYEIPRKRGVLLKETGSRKANSRVQSLLSDNSKLPSLKELDRHDHPESYERYGYRSFDRQWVIADKRVADAPKLHLWRVRGPHQVFLTTLTSTKLGRGPVTTVTPYIPDLDHFSGRGSKDVMPLYHDQDGRIPNVTKGLVGTLSSKLRSEVQVEDLLAYVYALTGTATFSERFNSELSEVAGPVHVPTTADPALFKRAVSLGRVLLWWHTWGERFIPLGCRSAQLPEGQPKEITPVAGMPETFSYTPDTELLRVGTGQFGPVSPKIWNFEVSGLKVLPSWLNYRKKNRKGRKSSYLNSIRPNSWTQTNELLRLLAILEHTIEVTKDAASLLEEIVAGPLLLAADIPTPTDIQRKPFKA